MTKMAAKWLKSIPNLWPKRLKTIPFWAAHTYIAHISITPRGFQPTPSISSLVVEATNTELINHSIMNVPRVVVVCGSIEENKRLDQKFPRWSLSSSSTGKIVKINVIWNMFLPFLILGVFLLKTWSFTCSWYLFKQSHFPFHSSVCFRRSMKTRRGDIFALSLTIMWGTRIYLGVFTLYMRKVKCYSQFDYQ